MENLIAFRDSEFSVVIAGSCHGHLVPASRVEVHTSLSCIDDSFTMLGLCAVLCKARMAQANCMPPRPSISDRLVDARPRKYRRPCAGLSHSHESLAEKN